jgi:hypothetical protein
MLLLTATRETQSQRPGDFCDAVEGELVVAFADCYVSAHTDSMLRCREGCPARYFGPDSHQASTTARQLVFTGRTGNHVVSADREQNCLPVGEP